jgi:hypothetical protein
METAMVGTWYKLKDETWGVKVRFAATLGERVAKFDDAELWSVA